MIAPVIPLDGLPSVPSPGDGDTSDPAGVADTAQAVSGEASAGEPTGNQPAIWDTEPEPRQLALLPDPDAWEADRPAPAATRGRLARRRRRNTIPPPDQLSLF